MNDDVVFVYPGIVPIKLLSKLESAGLRTTTDVHYAIRRGTLTSLPGIGKATERKVLQYYTATKSRILDKNVT